jgi:hypothetical protein
MGDVRVGSIAKRIGIPWIKPLGAVPAEAAARL